jgi:hypothetical protein
VLRVGTVASHDGGDSVSSAAPGLKDAAVLRRLCRARAMPGAILKDKTWLVPPEPVDWYRRERTGRRGRPPEQPAGKQPRTE